jgi:hypothetical protein
MDCLGLVVMVVNELQGHHIPNGAVCPFLTVLSSPGFNHLRWPGFDRHGCIGTGFSEEVSDGYTQAVHASVQAQSSQLLESANG